MYARILAPHCTKTFAGDAVMVRATCCSHKTRRSTRSPRAYLGGASSAYLVGVFKEKCNAPPLLNLAGVSRTRPAIMERSAGPACFRTRAKNRPQGRQRDVRPALQSNPEVARGANRDCRRRSEEGTERARHPRLLDPFTSHPVRRAPATKHDGLENGTYAAASYSRSSCW
jgi:hypothetical protein